MKYILVKIPYTSGKPENVIVFENEFSACGLCSVGDFGFLIIYKNNHFLSLINKKIEVACPWLCVPNERGNRDGCGTYARLSYPSSACYSKSYSSAYVVGHGGSRIHKIDLQMVYSSSVFGIYADSEMDKYISKIRNIEDVVTQCCIGENETIYWSASNLHRCFKYENSVPLEVIGVGRPDYTVASNAKLSSVYCPSGISWSNAGVYIADSGNHCIRLLKNDVSVVLGNPLVSGDKDGNSSSALLSNPYALRKSGEALYFIDNGKVKCYSLTSKNVGTVYCSNHTVDIDIDDRNNLFVLETE